MTEGQVSGEVDGGGKEYRREKRERKDVWAAIMTGKDLRDPVVYPICIPKILLCAHLLCVHSNGPKGQPGSW